MIKAGALHHRVWWWLTDGLYDSIEKRFGEPALERVIDHIERWVEKPLVRLLCKLFEHKPGSDCSIPEHDFCIYCGRSMPGQAARQSNGMPCG
jgi:hypothetical protein